MTRLKGTKVLRVVGASWRTIEGMGARETGGVVGAATLEFDIGVGD